MQIGFLGLLGLIFITLKLIGYIDWAWWLVLAPLWAGIALVFALIMFGVIWSMVFKRPVQFYVRRNKK